jgi:hypothetical protein
MRRSAPTAPELGANVNALLIGAQSASATASKSQGRAFLPSGGLLPVFQQPHGIWEIMVMQNPELVFNCTQRQAAGHRLVANLAGEARRLHPAFQQVHLNRIRRREESFHKAQAERISSPMAAPHRTRTGTSVTLTTDTTRPPQTGVAILTALPASCQPDSDVSIVSDTCPRRRWGLTSNTDALLAFPRFSRPPCWRRC